MRKENGEQKGGEERRGERRGEEKGEERRKKSLTVDGVKEDLIQCRLTLRKEKEMKGREIL